MLAAGLAAQGIVDRFPQPRQVLRDFGDDPGRRVALQILYQMLQEKAPVPRSEAASRRITEYFRAWAQVESTYTRMRSDAPARRTYFARVNRLLADPGFRRQVLNRYRLADLPVEGRPSVRVVQRDPFDDPARLFAPAFPFWLASLTALLLLPLLFQLSAWRAAASATGSSGSDDTNLLIKALRVLRLPGAPFEVSLEIGTVLENRPGGLWVRTPFGERLWKIPYADFATRQGHLITRVGQARSDGSHQTVLAMNYDTGQYVYPVRIEDPLGPRHSRRPWLVMTAIGATGFTLGIGAVARLEPLLPPVNWFSAWFIGACVSAVVAGVTGGLTARALSLIRNRRFQRYWVPELVEYAKLLMKRLQEQVESSKLDKKPG
jgi:hypothetical protein